MVRKIIPVNEEGKNLSTVGGRLAAERGRIGMTVQDFGIQCGVTKQTQIKYESNQNSPDTRYLSAAMTRGVDVMYVLTGIRSVEALPDEHQNLIEAYEAAPDPLRRAAFAVLVSPYLRKLDRAQHDPGFFQHELRGEADVRYQKSRAGTGPQTPIEAFDASLIDNGAADGKDGDGK